jgi:hypothetical protein
MKYYRNLSKQLPCRRKTSQDLVSWEKGITETGVYRLKANAVDSHNAPTLKENCS